MLINDTQEAQDEPPTRARAQSIDSQFWADAAKDEDSQAAKVEEKEPAEAEK